MMYDAIKNFHIQFAYEPRIENEHALRRFSKFVVVGMGGSHLAADILKIQKPDRELTTHKDYGLPPLPVGAQETHLVIISSYSGNTEEVLDALEYARKNNYATAAFSVGGAVRERAQEYKIPYVEIPDTGIQPRSALGFMAKALLKIFGDDTAIATISELSQTFNATLFEEEGKLLAERMHGFIPLIYASHRNEVLAANWKIKFNETGKIPAFYNVFPELNHNEMTGFDIKDSTLQLSKQFYFIFLQDNHDHPRIIKRMEITRRLLQDRGFPVYIKELPTSDNVFYKIFSSLILADWTAYYTAMRYGVDSEQVPMVEEFKKLITER